MTSTPRDPSPASAAGSDGPQYLSHRQILVVMSGVMAGMLLAALDISIMGTALPRIVSEFGGLDRLPWVVTAYLLTSTASTPLWGKVSDLYGRRVIYQTAIGIFLLGSVLAGISASMEQLITFRALQGLGGGGLMAVAMAIVGDVISPRQRGRYQGYLGAVWALSSVAGPLLGGWLTDGPGWRWIFWINVPIGGAALVVTSVVLRMPVTKRQHSIDYLGAATIVGSATALLLYLNWAGDRFGWSSAEALSLLLLAVAFAALFVLVESRVLEPIIPLRLFAIRTYSVANAFSFIVGLVLFGAVVYLPVYLQAVLGMSPTASGLAMLPVVTGIAGISVAAGMLVARTGRYKVFPIVGACVLVVAQVLLSRLGAHTPYWQFAAAAFLLGAGLGLTMQILVLAVQNAVEHRDLGTATSSNGFFRMMGGAIGTALFGAVFLARLNDYLGERAGDLGGVRVNPGDLRTVQQLAEPAREIAITAFARAMDDVFLVGVPFTVFAVVLAFVLPELPLRSGHASSSSPAGR